MSASITASAHQAALVAENDALIRALSDAVQLLSHAGDLPRSPWSESPQSERPHPVVDVIHIEESLAALVARRATRVDALALTVQQAQRDLQQRRRESAVQIGRLQQATGRADVAVLALKVRNLRCGFILFEISAGLFLC
jgi:hypothetical protein